MRHSQRAQLAMLQDLARMKRDAQLARLAVIAQSRARLLAALDRLNGAQAPLGEDSAPGMIRARLRYSAWIEGRRRVLNERLALVNADYLAQRPEAVQAFGRAEALGKLLQRHRAKPGRGG